MTTTEELRKQVIELEAEEDARKAYRGEIEEQRQLKKKIIVLKHPKAVRTVRVIGGVARRTAGGLGIMARSTGRFLGRTIVKAGKNYASNNSEARPARRRIVRRVVKRRRRRPARRRRRPARRPARRQESNRTSYSPNMRNIFG